MATRETQARLLVAGPIEDCLRTRDVSNVRQF
jgi:hypothetical protein